eukprot:Pgem_evm1s5349
MIHKHTRGLLKVIFFLLYTFKVTAECEQTLTNSIIHKTYGKLNAIYLSGSEDGKDWGSKPKDIPFGATVKYGAKHHFLGSAEVYLK